MVLPNETIQTGASNICPDCHDILKPQVIRSNAGYYIGTMCQCGPYSRESGYYSTFAKASEALALNTYSRE